MSDDLNLVLFERYCVGDATAEEAATLEAWFLDHPEQRTWYEQVRTGLNAGSPVSVSPIDLARRTDAIISQIHRHSEAARASIGPVAPPDARVQPDAHTRSTRGISFQRNPLRRISWIRLASVGAALVLTAVAVRHWRTPAPVPERIVSTAPGERATIRLADGTSVILGAQSKLRYASQFADHDRDVYLEGEAYFSVSHQSSKPFTVYTAHSATRVLGTAFLVKAYPDERGAEVVVTDGRVALRPPKAAASSGTTLVHGDLARIDTAGLITVTRAVAVEPYLEWTHGHLLFTRATLGSILPDLERWYDLKFVLTDPAIARSQVTISLDVESVDQAIEALADVSGLKWNRVGNTVTVSHPHAR